MDGQFLMSEALSGANPDYTTAFDDLLNSAMILPYLLAMGAMASSHPSRPVLAEKPHRLGTRT